jgi:hypothetical protein
MSFRKAVPVLLVVLAGSVLAGCSDPLEEEGAQPSSTSPQGGGQKNGVPQVDNPLDATPFLRDPCSLVDNRTLAEFGTFGQGEPDVDSNHAKKLIGPSCTWYADDEFGVSAEVVIDTPHQKYADPELRGLGGVYSSKESGMIDYLQQVEIAGHPGYPAVIAGDKEELSGGRCVVYVGIANDLNIKTAFDKEGDPSQACAAAQKIAGAALNSLKQAN